MIAVNGAVLLVALTLAGAIILTVAIRREGKRVDVVVAEVLAAPARPEPPKPEMGRTGGLIRTCNGPCRRRYYQPLGTFGDLLAALSDPAWVCQRCIEATIAAHESEFAS